jgi:hypothetical protein
LDTVDTGLGNETYTPSTSVAVDSSGTVHIVYTDKSDYSLKYATGTYGAWELEVIDGDINWFGGHASIAVSR